MSQLLYLRNQGVVGCGPGTKRTLETTSGSRAATQLLDATGDSWIIIPSATSPPGAIYAAGTWTALLYLKTSLGDVTVNVVLARWSAYSVCVEQEKMLDEDITVSGGSFILYTVNDSAGQVAWQPNDVLLCIVKLTSGADATLEYDQPTIGGGAGSSRITFPDAVTVRPHEYYKRQRRRRAN